MAADDIAEDRRRAEVFDSLSHPTRIMILKALNEGPLGFADLKKKLGIESSGHLQHHLSKLGNLVKTDEYGKYALSDQGKDALLSVETVEKVAESKTKDKQMSFRNGKRNFVWKTAVIALAFLLVVSSSLAILQYNQTLSLENQVKKQDGTLSNQNSTISNLENLLTLAQLSLSSVYINGDGSVTGTSSIQRNGDIYVLTGNISGSIIVQRSNMTIDGAGYTLQGNAGLQVNGGTGIDLTNNITQVPSAGEIFNVTVKNLRIMDFVFGIRTEGGGNDAFYNNYIGNSTNTPSEGIRFWASNGNNITRCTISGAPAIDMTFTSSHNTVTENNILGGLWQRSGGDATVDRNYWSDYLTKYPNATEIDSSGIGNVPYVFNSFFNPTGILQDNHPLMKPVSTPNFGVPSPYPYARIPSPYGTVLSQYQVNVTQGETFQINLTITGLLNETRTFTPEVQLAGYGNAAWDPSKDSHQLYNATFSQTPLLLEPNVDVPLTLTFNIAQDAPLGRYVFAVGNVQFIVIVTSK